MAKTKVSEFDAVASNNTDINSVNVAEGCPPSGINNAIREMASLLKKQEVGTDAMTSPDINGGTIDGATIGGSSGVTIGVSDGTVSAPSIKFTSDTNTGIYRGGTDILKFVTAGTDAITIDASQNVGINESNPSSSLHIYGSTPKITLEHSNENGTAQIYTTAQSAIILDADPDNTDSGTPIQFKIDGSEVGRFDSGGRLIAPYGVTLGTSAGTYVAGNTLDDYEEGTFEVTASPETSGTITLTSGDNTFAYTKVGRMVTITGLFVVSAVSSPVGDYVRILGLPFTQANLTDNSERVGISCIYYDYPEATPFGVEPAITIGAVTEFRIYRPANTWGVTDNVYVNFSYFTT